MALIYILWKNETKLCEAKVLFICFIFLFLDDRSSRPEAPPATSLKKRLWHRCFPVNFEKFLRTTFFIEQLWWLLSLMNVFITVFFISKIFIRKLV